MEEMHVPQLLPAEPQKPLTDLLGITVCDLEPFGEALEALGVPENEIGEWRIYPGCPGDNDLANEPKTIAIHTCHLSQVMTLAASDKNNKLYNWRYVQAFDRFAGSIVLNSMVKHVYSVASAESSAKERRIAAALQTARRASFAASFTTLGLLDPHDLLLDAVDAYGIHVATRYVVQRTLARRSRRAMQRLTEQALDRDPELTTKLRGAIAPLYS